AAHIKSGYDNLWRTTADSARDSLKGLNWHRTNDIGHIDDAGRVWLEGRLQHVVTTAAGPVGAGGPEALIDGDHVGRRRPRVRRQGRLHHVVPPAAGPVGPGGLEALIDADAEVSRSAVVGIGPVGTQALVAVLDSEGTSLSPGLAPLELTARLREQAREAGF